MNKRIATAFFVFGLAAGGLAQTSVVLDGTSGTNVITNSYSTTGGLNLSQGFFADYLVIGGGGSGGTAGSVSGTGGGGAGGLLQGNMQLSASNYSVTVGAGGVAPNTAGSSSVQGVNGSNSVFGNLTAVGGGGGGRFGIAGNSGGSGGGGGGRNNTAGGAGTTSNSIVQGFAGGTARGGNDTGRSGGGGGGGAGSVGGNGAPTSSTAGNGGAGLTNSITGSAVVYAGGGGGGAFDSNSGAGETAGTGGTGGGGAGSTSGNASNGTDGLGGGGGGAGDSGRGGNGGSGVVIVRYQGASLGTNIGGTVTSGTGTATGYTIHTFTNTGNANFDMSSINMANRLGATLNGAITGSGDVSFSGPGTLTLGASNSYSGATTISSGTLRVANAGTLGNGSGAVTNNSALVLDRSDSYVLANSVTGTGTVTQQGSGTTILTGNNTYQGATTISGGNLQVGNGGTTGTLGSAAVSLGASNATLVFNRSDNVDLNNAVTGTGKLTQAGSGVLTVLSSNAYTGGTVISSGSLKVGNGGTAGQLGGGGVAISNGASLVFDRSDAVTVANGLSGAGSLRQSGAGTLTVGGANSYSGGTVIDSGRTLKAAGGLGSGAVVNNGTMVYDRSGWTTFANNISGSGSLDVANTGWHTFTGSNSYTGTTRVRGTEVTLGQNALAGSTLTTFTSDTSTALEIKGAVSGANVNVGGLAGNRRVYVGSTVKDLNLGGNNENTVLSGNSDFNNSGSVIKVGTGTTTLAGNMNFLKGAFVRSGTLEIASGDSLFSQALMVGAYAGDNGTFLVSGGTNSMFFSSLHIGREGTGTFNVTGGKTVAAGIRLSLQDSGLPFGGSGTMNVSGGRVENSSNMHLGNGTINISGGIVTNSGVISMGPGVSAINLTGNGILAAKSISIGGTNNQINIGTGGSAGELRLTEGIAAWTTNAGSVVNFNHSNSSYTLGGNINGSKLALNQNGSGKTILTGVLAWGGGTTISGGTLQLGNGGAYSPGASDRNPLAQSLVNHGTLAINYGGSGGVVVNGVISGTGAFLKEGSARVILAGANTYSGGTTVQGGNLELALTGQLLSGSDLTVNSGATFTLNNTSLSQTLGSLSGAGAVNLGKGMLTIGADDSNSEFSGRISGAGGVTKSGTGVFTLSGSNNFTGDTSVNHGTLVLANSNSLGKASVVKIGAGGTLEASQRVVVGFVDLNGGTIIGSNNLVSSLTLINSGSVSGLANGSDFAAGILKRTAGVATVDGANSFTGTVKIEAGTVQMVEGGSFNSGSSLFLYNGATMDLNNRSQAFSQLDGAAGTVSLGSGNLTVNGADSSDFGGVIQGSGKVVKDGTGVMTLTGANTYSGGTEVVGGRLVGSTTSLSGAITNGAIVEFRQDSNATLGASITGSGSVVKSGTGALTVSDAQTYTGTTSVQGGALKVNGSLAGGVTVDSSGLLGGSGTVGGLITVSDGGTLSPGNSPGILTAANGLSLATGSTFTWELTGNNDSLLSRGTLYDGVDVTGGSLFIGSGVTSSLVFDFVGSTVDWTNSFWDTDQTWTVFDAVSASLASVGIFDSVSLSADSTGAVLNNVTGRENASFNWTTSENKVFLNYNAVPEPSAASLIVFGAGALLALRRRRGAV